MKLEKYFAILKSVKPFLTQVRQNYEKSKKILLKIDGYHPLTLVGGRIPPENIL